MSLSLLSLSRPVKLPALFSRQNVGDCNPDLSGLDIGNILQVYITVGSTIPIARFMMASIAPLRSAGSALLRRVCGVSESKRSSINGHLECAAMSPDSRNSQLCCSCR